MRLSIIIIIILNNNNHNHNHNHNHNNNNNDDDDDDDNNNNSNKDNNNNNNNDDDNKIIIFEMLHSLDLVDSVPPWYSPSEPRPVNQNDQVQAFWDVPVYADHVTVRANRVDARIVDSTATSVTLLEMSCQ